MITPAMALAVRRPRPIWKSRAVSGPAVDESEEPGSAEAISSQSGVTLRPWFLADLNLIGASSRSEGRMALLFQAQSPCPPRRSRNFGHSDAERDRALRVGRALVAPAGSDRAMRVDPAAHTVCLMV